MVESLKEINEVIAAGSQVDDVEVRRRVANHGRESHCLSQHPRPIHCLLADIEAGERPEREAMLFEDAIKVARAAAERKRIAHRATREEPFAQPVHPIGVPAPGDEEIVVEMNLWNPRP